MSWENSVCAMQLDDVWLVSANPRKPVRRLPKEPISRAFTRAGKMAGQTRGGNILTRCAVAGARRARSASDNGRRRRPVRVAARIGERVVKDGLTPVLALPPDSPFLASGAKRESSAAMFHGNGLAGIVQPGQR